MTEGKQETIHVALSVYDPKGTYSQHAGVVMTSIFEHTDSPVCVHILHDETLTDDNRRKFVRTAEKYDQTVELVDVTAYKDGLDEGTVRLANSIHSVGALYRLFIPDLLPLDKIIYLDADVLVNLDIQELWDIDMEGNCLAGALDVKEGRPFSFHSTRLRLNGSRPEAYANSGVLLMDLARIREQDLLFPRATAWLARRRHAVRCPDQDTLNALFFGSIKLIDGKFNSYDLERDPSGTIVHAFQMKPWLGLVGLPSERLYWKMYLRSAWGEDKGPDELIDVLSHAAPLSPELHRHTRQCWHRIGLRLWRDIFCNELFSVIWLLVKEALFQLRSRGGRRL